MIKNFGVSLGLTFPGVCLINGLVIGMLFWWWKKNRLWGLLIIIAGGSLNLMERCVRGYVVDYWRIPGTNVYNNLNDWLIFGGAMIFIWQYLKVKKSK